MLSLDTLRPPPVIAAPSRRALSPDDIIHALELTRDNPFSILAEAREAPNGCPAIHFTDGGLWLARQAGEEEEALAELAAGLRDHLLFLTECVNMKPQELGEEPYRAAHELFLHLDRLELLARRAKASSAFQRYEGLPGGDAELEGKVIAGSARWVGALVEPATMGVFAATPSGRSAA